MALVQIQLRRDTTTNWTTANPILQSGEPGYDTVLKILKIGDGVTTWDLLPIYGTFYSDQDVEEYLNSKNVVSGSSANITTDYVTFDTTPETSSSLQGTMSWNADEITLDLIQNGTTLQLGQEQQYNVRNNSGQTIPNGMPVMASGTIGNSNRITIAPMNGSSPLNAKYLLGIATETILDGNDGKVTTFGKVRGINTEDWNEGDILWVSSSANGELTNIEPSRPTMAMPIAFVINSHSNGTIFVRVNNLNQHEFVGISGDNIIDGSLNVTNGITGSVFEGVKSTLANETISGSVITNIIQCTQAQYDAGTPVAGTQYIIIG